MILLDLKRYIREHRQVSIDDLQNHFDLDKDALNGLLAPLLSQGHIQKVSSDGGCSTGTCNSGCGSAAKEMIYWTSKKLKSIQIPIQVGL